MLNFKSKNILTSLLLIMLMTISCICEDDSKPQNKRKEVNNTDKVKIRATPEMCKLAKRVAKNYIRDFNFSQQEKSDFIEKFQDKLLYIVLELSELDQQKIERHIQQQTNLKKNLESTDAIILKQAIDKVNEVYRQLIPEKFANLVLPMNLKQARQLVSDYLVLLQLLV